MSSVGVEISPKRCKKARLLDLSDMISRLTPGRMSILGLPRSDQPKFHKVKHTENINNEIKDNQISDMNMAAANIVYADLSILRAVIPLAFSLLFHLSVISLAYFCVRLVFDGMVSNAFTMR